MAEEPPRIGILTLGSGFCLQQKSGQVVTWQSPGNSTCEEEGSSGHSSDATVISSSRFPVNPIANRIRDGSLRGTRRAAHDVAISGECRIWKEASRNEGRASLGHCRRGLWGDIQLPPVIVVGSSMVTWRMVPCDAACSVQRRVGCTEWSREDRLQES